MKRLSVLPIAMLLLACTEPHAGRAPAGLRDAALGAVPANRAEPSASRAPAWIANPAAHVTLSGGGETLRVEAGPHSVVWPAGAVPIAPPYTIRATLQKHTGRIHEGTGILFGGEGLDRAESEQKYAYFLTRGDGSFLIKQRDGANLIVVQDWTTHPAIRRDGEEGGRPNDLEVRATKTDAAFFVNGVEVARVPAEQLRLAGIAGLRVSHELQLEVTGFRVQPGAPAPAGRAP
jgi:hypothetical protein